MLWFRLLCYPNVTIAVSAWRCWGRPAVKRQSTILGTSGHQSNTPIVAFDSQDITSKFPLMFYSNLSNRCQVISIHIMHHRTLYFVCFGATPYNVLIAFLPPEWDPAAASCEVVPSLGGTCSPWRQILRAHWWLSPVQPRRRRRTLDQTGRSSVSSGRAMSPSARGYQTRSSPCHTRNSQCDCMFQSATLASQKCGQYLSVIVRWSDGVHPTFKGIQ